MNTFARRYAFPVIVALLWAFTGFAGLYAQEATLEPVVEAPAPVVVVEAPLVSNSVIVGLVAVVGFLVGIIGTIRRGGNADQSAALQLGLLQQNRAAMEAYERQLTAATATTRMAIGAITGIIKVLAPLTPWESDNALGDFLEDIQTEGPPLHTDPPSPGSLSQPNRID